MATKTDFTDQEWESLQKGVSGAGLLVSLSDRSVQGGRFACEAHSSGQAEQFERIRP